MSIKQIASAFTAGLAVLLAVPVIALAATTEVVLEADVARQAENTPPTNEWVLYTRAGTPATAGAFVDGPGDPPLNDGSFQMTTADGGQKVYLFNYEHIGTPLDEIGAISYSTYRTAGTGQQVAALNLQVDFNGPEVAGGFTTLVFEPVYNINQGAVVSGEWQDWDALNGGDAVWWSSNPIPSAPNRDTFVSWDTIVAANPDAYIMGGIGVNQGSGNPGLVSAVDAFTFDDTTYDFELVAPKPVRAESRDECKNGGWQNFQTPYKNQGDCVSSVASNGRAGGNPSVFETISTRVRGLFN